MADSTFTPAQRRAAGRDKKALDELHAFLYEDPEEFPSGSDVCEELARVLEATGRKPPMVQ
jgi:hypothetical protein